MSTERATTTPDTGIALADAWQQVHCTREDLQTLPERFCAAAQAADAPAMRSLLRRADELRGDLVVAQLVARRCAIAHWEDRLRAAAAEVDRTQEAGEAARAAYQQGFSAPRDAEGNVIPPPEALATYQRAHGQLAAAQGERAQAQRIWDEEVAAAMRRLHA